MKTDKENEWREEFEQAKSGYYSCDKTKNHFGQYQSIEARCAWEAYLQACRARQVEIDLLKAELDFYKNKEKYQLKCGECGNVLYYYEQVEYADIINNLKAEPEKARELIKSMILDCERHDRYFESEIARKQFQAILNDKAKEFLKNKGR